MHFGMMHLVLAIVQEDVCSVAVANGTPLLELRDSLFLCVMQRRCLEQGVLHGAQLLAENNLVILGRPLLEPSGIVGASWSGTAPVARPCTSIGAARSAGVPARRGSPSTFALRIASEDHVIKYASIYVHFPHGRSERRCYHKRSLRPVQPPIILGFATAAYT